MKTEKSGLRLVGPASRKKAKQNEAPAASGATALLLAARAASYVSEARSESTRRAYETDWRHFAAWCSRSGFTDLPATPETVSLYLVAHAERLKPATLERRLVSVSQKHQEAGHEPPTRTNLVRKTYAGICREVGTAQRKKAPLITADLKAVVALLPDTLHGRRDKALLLVGFSGAFRRSEVAALNVADILPDSDGFVVTIRKSKTDQEKKGRTVGIPMSDDVEYCPVRACKAWMAAASIKSGPVFRGIDMFGNVSKTRLTGQGIAYILKQSVARAGLDPALYAGHSLRAGHVTSAARGGASERDIMAQTGHTSERIMRGYIRDANRLGKNNSARRTGL